MIIMNIFYLDQDPKICAYYHCDRHVHKMVSEYSQILSTAIRVMFGKPMFNEKGKIIEYELNLFNNRILKHTHEHSPCVKWVMYSLENYKWLLELLRCLHNVYEQVFGRRHLYYSNGLINLFSILPISVSKEFLLNEFTEPPKVVSDICKLDTTIESYRLLYMTEKRNIVKYKNRPFPEWFR